MTIKGKKAIKLHRGRTRNHVFQPQWLICQIVNKDGWWMFGILRSAETMGVHTFTIPAGQHANNEQSQVKLEQNK